MGTSGSYALSFMVAQRATGNDSYQRLRVSLRPSSAASTAKTFVWSGNIIAEERGSTGTSASVRKRFFAEGEQRVGGSDAGKYYYSRDHLGSIREVTNENGEPVAKYDYDAWGKSVVVTGNMSVDFGYTGHYFHQPSGLNLAMYRAYSPTLGRWISRDPIGELAGVNLYRYVSNDPVDLWDPLGLKDILIGIAPRWFTAAQLKKYNLASHDALTLDDNAAENNANAVAILQAIDDFKRNNSLDGDTVDVGLIASKEDLASRCKKYDDIILFAHGNTAGSVQGVALGYDRIFRSQLPGNCTPFGCTIGHPQFFSDVLDQMLQQLRNDLRR